MVSGGIDCDHFVAARWDGLEGLEDLLPPCKLMANSSGVHRYGFSQVLAEKCGLDAPRRAFANWVHGWIWDEMPTAESLHCAGMPLDVTVVVRNMVEAIALRQEGFQRVEIGGLPFAYVGQQHPARRLDALLAIPPHSAEVERMTSQQQDYMDYLESLKDAFDGIYVSVFYLDWDGPIHHAAVARGLNVVQGARPDDANSLGRMRALFEAFDQVTTNNMGSHFVYALHSGCRFSFCGPMFTYDADILLASGNPNRHSKERIDRLIAIQAPDYLRGRFGRFFVESPNAGIADRAFASQEVGECAVMDPEEIMTVLGWRLPDQLRGYLAGGLRRMRRRSVGS